jgi:hypothetical protein
MKHHECFLSCAAWEAVLRHKFKPATCSRMIWVLLTVQQYKRIKIKFTEFKQWRWKFWRLCINWHMIMMMMMMIKRNVSHRNACQITEGRITASLIWAAVCTLEHKLYFKALLVQLTDSTELRLCYEANNCLSTPEFPSPSWNQNVKTIFTRTWCLSYSILLLKTYSIISPPHLCPSRHSGSFLCVSFPFMLHVPTIPPSSIWTF